MMLFAPIRRPLLPVLLAAAVLCVTASAQRHGFGGPAGMHMQAAPPRSMPPSQAAHPQGYYGARPANGTHAAYAPGGQQGYRPVAPIERRAPEPQPAQPAPNGQRLAPIERRSGTQQKGEHLAEWMSRHSNLTPQQQQQALETEPGFRELPAQTQQRFRDRLNQLNAMTPQQRQRLLSHNEMMEHLSPDQRTQIRFATQQWAALPPQQKFEVKRSFRALRAMPPEQRAAALASGRYTAPFTEQQKAALNGLLRVEPMLPPDE